MDIRTKMVFTLVAVALGSMVALAYMTYRNVAAEFDAARMEQLVGLAEFKVESLEGIVDGWHERVSLVASRAQLVSSLSEHNASGDPQAARGLARILDQVRAASPAFHHLSVHGPSGELVAESGPDAGHAPAELDLETRAGDDDAWFRGAVFPEDGEMALAGLVAPLEAEGETIGYLHALLSIDDVVEISRSYEGLGSTGETMVVALDDGVPRILHPVRAAQPIEGSGADTVDASRFRGVGLRIPATGPAAQALEGTERRFAGGVVDYRGQEIWAATDFLPGVGWGVVVKVDAAEQTRPIDQIRSVVVRLGVTLAAFAILIGTVLGIRFAQPIHLLSEAANRIRAGDLGARTGIEREDEVGLLAQTFDRMAAELEDQVDLLTEYRLFFDMSLDMMCIADTDGYFRRVNEAFTRELGWSEEELLARPFVSFVHPDDVDKTMAEVRKLDEGIPTVRFENRYQCKDGSYKLLRWRSSPHRDSGRLYAIARVEGAAPTESSP